MGTLGNQPKRPHKKITPDHLEDFLNWLEEIAKKRGISLSDAIQAAKVLEMRRRNDLFVTHGDYLDEQAGGFGDIARELVDAIKRDDG